MGVSHLSKGAKEGQVVDVCGQVAGGNTAREKLKPLVARDNEPLEPGRQTQVLPLFLQKSPPGSLHVKTLPKDDAHARGRVDSDQAIREAVNHDDTWQGGCWWKWTHAANLRGGWWDA